MNGEQSVGDARSERARGVLAPTGSGRGEEKEEGKAKRIKQAEISNSGERVDRQTLAMLKGRGVRDGGGGSKPGGGCYEWARRA
jgi:hypothetical protein